MDSKRLIIRRIFWLLLPVIFLLVGWGILRNGLALERLDIAGLQAEKLYLKLDKRLRFRAKRVVLPRRNAQREFSLRTSLEWLHGVLRFFDAVELESVVWGGEEYHLLYKEGILYLRGGAFQAAGMVYDRGDGMEVQFPLVEVPKYGVTLSGELYYRYADGTIRASGYYNIPDLNGEFRLTKAGKELYFHLDSDETKSLQKLMTLFSMSREAKEWLSRRISAEGYRLEGLEGRGRFEWEEGRFRPDLSSLHATVALRSPRIRFHDKLSPISARSARVVLKDGSLYFLLHHPRYGRHDLEGSHAALTGLNDPKRLTLLLRLYYRGRIDWPVIKILRTYGLKIDIGQREGRSRSRVDIDIPLGREGHVKIRGITRFGRGVIEVGKKPVRIDGGEVAYTSRKVVLRRLKIRERSLRGTLGGEVDLAKRKGRFALQVKRAEIAAAGEVLARLKAVTVPLRLRWDDRSVGVRMPTLHTEAELQRRGDAFRVVLGSLASWKPYLSGMFRRLDDGKVRVVGSSKGVRLAEGELVWNDAPFYTRSGWVTRFPFTIRPVGTALRIEALGGNIAFRADEHVLKITRLNVDAERLLRLRKPKEQERNLHKGKNGGGLTVLGSESNIRYGRYVLLTDTYRLEVSGNRLRFDGQLGSDHVRLLKEGTTLRVDAKEIGDRMFHALTHFKGLRGGRYTLHMVGSAENGYTGEILIDGGVLKDVKAYNDMIALFNTIPALVSFSSPGFSRKGFEIKKGRILFTLQKETLRLESILLEGRSSTVAGKGTVNLGSKALDIELAIRTAREMGKALGQIPMVGYILFGKDKSLTAGVKITGTLQKPKVRTNPVAEALLYPLELLKRTLMAPGRLGQRDEELPDEASSPPPAERKRQERNDNDAF